MRIMMRMIGTTIAAVLLLLLLLSLELALDTPGFVLPINREKYQHLSHKQIFVLPINREKYQNLSHKPICESSEQGKAYNTCSLQSFARHACTEHAHNISLQMTPASSWWLQSVGEVDPRGDCLQLSKLSSSPVHFMLISSMGPLPPPVVCAVAPVWRESCSHKSYLTHHLQFSRLGIQVSLAI